MGIHTCPLCCSTGPLDAPILIDHVLEHTHDFALRSLPWADLPAETYRNLTSRGNYNLNYLETSQPLEPEAPLLPWMIYSWLEKLRLPRSDQWELSEAVLKRLVASHPAQELNSPVGYFATNDYFGSEPDDQSVDLRSYQTDEDNSRIPEDGDIQMTDDDYIRLWFDDIHMADDDDDDYDDDDVQSSGDGGIQVANDDIQMIDTTPGPVNNWADSKIQLLEKEDGDPLWREDIQYDFLRAIFDNEEDAFTNSYDPSLSKQNFADLYIDTISRSTDISNVLRDRLLNDRDAAKCLAMICLLFNIGRIDTNLDFFPEMQAQARTFHAIPSLQIGKNGGVFEMIRNSSRLESILKGSAEDRKEPDSLMEIKEDDNVPRTNPANLIFIICKSTPKINELHFPVSVEFHDLIMNTQLSSKSRAVAFLWLLWHHLESDFTEEGCEENPFGPGIDYGLDVANQGVPKLEEMSGEEQATENMDTPEEIEFGNMTRMAKAQSVEKGYPIDPIYSK